MTLAQQAKLAGLYFAIASLQDRLDSDITDEAERKAYQKEINRLIRQQQKIYNS